MAAPPGAAFFLSPALASSGRWYNNAVMDWSRLKLSTMSLRTRITVLVMATVMLSVVVEILNARNFIQQYMLKSGSDKVLQVARDLAADPEIVAAFGSDAPQYIIQPIAERARKLTGTSFIVVMNMDCIRYSHPAPSRIGRKFIGGDESRALKGESYVSTASGALATSMRSFVPVIDDNDRQIGVVVVGLNISDVRQEVEAITKVLYYIGIVVLVIGVAGSTFLAGNIKKGTQGLEPMEIATLLKERDAIISSVKEGIIAVDRGGRLLLMNDSAKKILAIESSEQFDNSTALADSLGLTAIIESGKPSIDDEIEIDGKEIVANRIPMVSDGVVIGAVSTLRDRSEMKLLRGELMAIKQYTTALRAQKHEFMNKLQVVSGLLQLGRYDDAVAYMDSTVSKQQQSVDQLRNAIEPAEILALVLAKMDEAHEQGIEMTLSEDSHLPDLRNSVAPAFITIIGNLLQNAIEALRNADVETKKIELGFHLHDSLLEIRVWDNGSGIAPELREHLFQQGASSKGEGHMGVGLYLVKRQIEALGGLIEVRDNDGVAMIATVPEDSL